MIQIARVVRTTLERDGTMMGRDMRSAYSYVPVVRPVAERLRQCDWLGLLAK